jgi:hypothetical protein
VDSLGEITIRMFEFGDAFRLLGAIAGLRAADRKKVAFEGGYATATGSTLHLEFQGAPADAQPLKEFLDAQLRAAPEKTLSARFELGFTAGLGLSGDAPDKLTEQLTRFASGSAYVEAVAVETAAKVAA